MRKLVQLTLTVGTISSIALAGTMFVYASFAQTRNNGVTNGNHSPVNSTNTSGNGSPAIVGNSGGQNYVNPNIDTQNNNNVKGKQINTPNYNENNCNGGNFTDSSCINNGTVNYGKNN